MKREKRLQRKTYRGENLVHDHGYHNVIKGEEKEHDRKKTHCHLFPCKDTARQEPITQFAAPHLPPVSPVLLSSSCISQKQLCNREKSAGLGWTETGGLDLSWFLALCLWILPLTFLRASVSSFIKWEYYLPSRICAAFPST